MKSYVVTSGVAALVAWCAAGEAAAQGVVPRPPVSPYINLNRRGSSAAVNYYGIVRPLIEQQNINQQLITNQNQIQAYLAQPPLQFNTADGDYAYPVTGHPTQLMSHLRYFQNRGTGTTYAPPSGGQALQRPVGGGGGGGGGPRPAGGGGAVASPRR